MRVLNTTQMRDAEKRTIDEIGVPAIVLMENAGRQVVAAMDAAVDRFADLDVVVLCGRGNNGGDGCVVARVLHERGVRVRVYLIGGVADIAGPARTSLEMARNVGVVVTEITDAALWELHARDALRPDVIVDALFGTGVKPPLSGLADTIVTDLNAADRQVVAIDLPSGLSADTAEVVGAAVRATMTVTLAAPKLPLFLPPADAHAGRVTVADIGIPEHVIHEVEGPIVRVITREAMLPKLAPRPADGHKGTFGHVLVVAGSRGKAGAASLAARAALRSGAGLVTVATAASTQPTVAALGAEYMTEALDETAEGTIAFESLERVLEIDADVIALGPGLGRSPSTMAFVHGLVEQAKCPVVLDADALHAFAGDADRLVGHEGLDLIITPHPGEMANLMRQSVADVQAHRLEVARDLATTHRLFVVLKGHRTIVVTPDGAVSVCLTGNPGMATGGTGDVLTGMIAAWCGQLKDSAQACELAVYLHGLAGDLAAANCGEISLVAGDVIDAIGRAILHVTGARSRPSPFC